MEERNGFSGEQWAGVKAGSWQESMNSDRAVSPELYKSSLSKISAKGNNTEPWHDDITFPWTKSIPTATLKAV